MANPRTPADEMFEEYLRAESGYVALYEPDYEAELGLSCPTNPDYLVRRAGALAVCEVKGFQKSKLAEALPETGYGAVGTTRSTGRFATRLIPPRLGSNLLPDKGCRS